MTSPKNDLVRMHASAHTQRARDSERVRQSGRVRRERRREKEREGEREGERRREQETEGERRREERERGNGMHGQANSEAHAHRQQRGTLPIELAEANCDDPRIAAPFWLTET